MQVPAASDPARFERLFGELADIGRDAPGGGWTRLAWTAADRDARAWFTATASGLGLSVEADRNGNLWAWWGPAPARGSAAVVAGSHLDTVPGGGAYDGALGVVGALCAVAGLREAGFRPVRPVAVTAFADEEGGRFGVATAGSRLLAGSLDPASVADRTDRDGVRLADAAAAAGFPALGPDPDRVASLACVLELHVEQGRALADRGAALAVASEIWPHLRCRFELTGEANHAGTTRLADRHDPVLVLAAAVTAARVAAGHAGGVATVGRVRVAPNSTNSVAGRAAGWLDARAPNEPALTALVADWRAAAAAAADAEGVAMRVVEESRTPAVRFDPALAGRLLAVLAEQGRPGEVLATAAGHDAGALAGAVPTGMLFVRNPTGVSHSPAEWAEPADCLLGIEALASALAELAGG